MISSYPHYDGASLNTFSRIDDSQNHSTPFGISIPQSSPPLSYASASTSASASASASASSSSTPSSSPPMPPFAVFEYDGDNDNDTERALSPYANGPIEIVPGVFLGAEESVFQVSAWGRGKRRVRVLNVAQEIEDPFASQRPHVDNGKGKERASVQVDRYPPSPGKGWPKMDYCHLKWSHGEAGLAGIPDQSTLDDFINPREPEVGDGNWGLWTAILYIEDARRRDIPVLIHCQCGVSRSATLIIAYLMALAASGLEPDLFGHLSGMQDAYNFVKSKSPCISPNVSLVFQLVEFARNVTTLLCRYPSASNIRTAWPKREEHEMSEAEWARRRAAFDDESGIGNGNGTEDSDGQGDDDMAMLASPMSIDEAEEEARYLDEAMRKRKGLM
ncbi:protein-tyrosine phosphatase-like protein [Naematelia encephala]|uniref:protein-tyrosine-phosphatase n=1 Tax=Naematelia encephala TaxID=71784 RepID=A0A1Y2AQK0_9TREE|nr:protein-tyrosine phosphatase-like protein [Naematelia encephala]